MGQRFAAAGTCVLLVESSAIIGLDLADELESQGYEVEGPFACAAAAQRLKTRTPDLAILDVDLRSGSCVGLARELRAREVPILIFSAHDRSDALAEFRSLPWLAMPAPKHALHAALRDLCVPASL
jgi:DNA-binding response OmpR family regulator